MLVSNIDNIDTSQIKMPKNLVEKIACLCLNSVINNAQYVGVRVSVVGLEACQAAFQESVDRLEKLYNSTADSINPRESFAISLLRSGNAWGNLDILLQQIKEIGLTESDITQALKFIIENMGEFAYLKDFYPDENFEIKAAFKIV